MFIFKKELKVPPQQVYQLFIQPELNEQFGGTNGMLEDFTVMDNVRDEANIMTIEGYNNILQRYGQNCTIPYANVGRAENRKVKTYPFVAATKICVDSYEADCINKLIDTKVDKFFLDTTSKLFARGLTNDIYTTAWFGDYGSINGTTFNTNKLDGVITKIGNYISNGVIPASQTIALPTSPISPLDAYTYLKQMLDARPNQLKYMGKKAQQFFVTQQLFDSYQDYLINNGTGCCMVDNLVNGEERSFFMGIPIKVIPLANEILDDKGIPTKNIAILTVAKNFLFATDLNYKSPNNMIPSTESFKLWYNDDEMVWKWRIFARFGVDIIAPNLIVYAEGQ